MLNGRIDIKYRRVECTPPVPIKVQIDGNSGPGGWLRLSVTVSLLDCLINTQEFLLSTCHCLLTGSFVRPHMQTLSNFAAPGAAQY